MKLKLKARINRSDARTIRNSLDQLAAKGSVKKAGDEFVVEAEMEGASARELNRKRLTNTPIRQVGSVLKCLDDRKNRVVSTQATYPCGSSAVGG